MIAEAFNDEALCASADLIKGLTNLDFSVFESKELAEASSRVRTVSAFVAAVDKRLRKEIGPHMSSVSENMKMLSERLIK